VTVRAGCCLPHRNIRYFSGCRDGAAFPQRRRPIGWHRPATRLRPADQRGLEASSRLRCSNSFSAPWAGAYRGRPGVHCRFVKRDDPDRPEGNNGRRDKRGRAAGAGVAALWASPQRRVSYVVIVNRQRSAAFRHVLSRNLSHAQEEAIRHGWYRQRLRDGESLEERSS